MSGLGLDAQELAVRRELEHREWELVELVRDEGLSASTLDRAGLQRALRLLAGRQADALIVAKLDRLSRSAADFALLVEWFGDCDATLVILDLGVDTSTPGGQLVANVFASLAQWERSTIAERTRAGLAALRARGQPAGRPAVSDQPELAARIRRMREEEDLSLQAIADQLNDEGVPTLRGAERWRVSSVQGAAGYRRPRRRRRRAALPSVKS